MTKEYLLNKYPYEIAQVIKWMKRDSFTPALLGGIPELFGDDNYRCENTWITKFKEVGINYKQPTRHKKLRKYFN